MCDKLLFQWISRVCQIKKNIKYIHQNLRYYETIVQLLYLSGNHIPLLMICTKINGHTENIKIYWNKKYHYIEKKVLCWNKFSVFRSDIETVWSTFHEKHFHCLMNMFAPFWHSHNYQVSRKCQEGKQDMFLWWSFYILLYFAEFCIIFEQFMTVWLLVRLMLLHLYRTWK